MDAAYNERSLPLNKKKIECRADSTRSWSNTEVGSRYKVQNLLDHFERRVYTFRSPPFD